ncbi:protealysin inhibitor emfourin [Rhodococcus sovatensis]|uniref:Protealysin inhibitor emfourin n=1 Tax=Rhodococcus sovatensis TaxID=1805840 RepID=A0ABZ2PNY0_9NOCA
MDTKDAVMFIEVIRVGGVAGLTKRAQIDTDAIADEASVREWRQLVEQARPLLVSQPNVQSSSTRERDTFVWTVSVDDTTCQLGDSSITGPLRDLAQRTLREGRRP